MLTPKSHPPDVESSAGCSVCPDDYKDIFRVSSAQKKVPLPICCEYVFPIGVVLQGVLVTRDLPEERTPGGLAGVLYILSTIREIGRRSAFRTVR